MTAKTSAAGAGVDILGGPVIDPTKNVIALVDVEKSHNRELREMELRHAQENRAADQKFNDKMLEFEIQRQRDLATLKQSYDNQISNIVTVQTKTTSDLIATQLDKVTTSLSNQISAAAAQQNSLMTTLSERIGKLEQSRWEVAGKSSVSDPATAESLTRMSNSIASLTNNTNESMVKITATMSEAIAKLNINSARSGGRETGEEHNIARTSTIIMAVIALAAVASPIVSALIIHGH
jgi:rubrerythrin